MPKTERRYLKELAKVLYDQEWLRGAKNFPVYHIQRGVKKKNGLRYDITTIPAKMLGKEFAKTKGHRHKGPCQELYIVLEGKATFLIQRNQGMKVKEIYAIKGKRGDSVIIPSYFGHITINSSKWKLKIGNWISEKCRSDYNFFEKMQGGAYYYTQSGWIKNKNYKKVPKLKFKKPLKSIPKDLDFLQ